MADLLFDEINNYRIVVAPERSKRPKDEFDSKHEKHLTCPFCPGNETMTPPNSYIVGGSSSGWNIGTFPNKYPAFVKNHKNVQLAGIQEVLVETEVHNQEFALLSIDQLKKILETYKIRIEYFKEREKAQYISVFKNHGELAGASLKHPHSQLIALFSIPEKIIQQNLKLEEFLLNHKKCYYCHLKDKSNLVYENKAFFCVMPNEARFSYECLILPKMHSPYFEHTESDQFYDLADIILKVTKAINSLLEFPSFNLVLNNGINSNSFNELSFHWHFQFIPRVNYMAGFEWATGMYIRQVDHETASKQLKELIQTN